MIPQKKSVDSRILLQRLKQALAEQGEAQARLNEIVKLIATSMESEVCSIYLRRTDDVLELYATEGLFTTAVHYSELKLGQGLVGKIAENAEPINTSKVAKTKGFRYLPETGEERFKSFLGVPIQRLGKVLGVLVIQNLNEREYNDDEVYGLEIVAMVLAEMAELGVFTESGNKHKLSQEKKGPFSAIGLIGKEGVALGTIVLLNPEIKITNPVADNPNLEKEKLNVALTKLKNELSENISRKHFKQKREFLEILETHKLLIEDKGWLNRMEASIDNGLSATVAVEKEQTETKARIAKVQNYYFKERLNELYEISNTLLRILTKQKSKLKLRTITSPILLARNVSPLELISMREHLKGVILEEGSVGSHATIICRALNIPLVIQVKEIIEKAAHGDKVILDGDQAMINLRPEEEVIRAYTSKLSMRTKAQESFLAIRDLSAVTLDGIKISLMINAGLMADLPSLAKSGAEGVGLYRTELQFLISNTVPKRSEQAQIYSKVLDSAKGLPVFFRTLDVGSDKILPSITPEIEPNPALGWRAIRLSLEKSGVFKMQAQALIRGAHGRDLNIVIPLVAKPTEFDQAKEIILSEIEREKRRKHLVPKSIMVGAMLEVPSLAFASESFFNNADFIMVGGNDLKQFFFAADRENEKVRRRYDVLSTSFLSFLSLICERCDQSKIPLSFCGEDAGKPIEALVLSALGFRTLSMQPDCIGPVKSLLRSVSLSEIKALITGCLEENIETVRLPITKYLEDTNIYNAKMANNTV
ncbi:MAG: phosphoenolpyruvate--protein phosphotransferase [Pseudomonadota bacterium]|nr:phosphoenolpyruvate--protein phosphotransferase [Pseudomonadota bacterium]